MRLSCLVSVLLALAASPMHAVGLAMNTDQSVYGVGEMITLTLTGDTAGAPAAVAIFVDVVYDDPSLVDGLGAVASQSAALTSGAGLIPWTAVNPACQPDRCTVFNQILGLAPLVPDPTILIGTLRIPTAAAGVLTLSTGEVDFFGASAPAPVTVTIVPEPASGALVALGLLVLGGGRRRRRASGS